MQVLSPPAHAIVIDMRTLLISLCLIAAIVPAEETPPMDTAIVAAGCFWGVEHAFAQVPGVSDVVSGYIGGTTERPTYEQICHHDTGHAEAVRITFDPRRVTFAQLLDVFWSCHDPTQVGGQGPDDGEQYRSAIFVLGDAQRAAALAAKAAAQVYFDRQVTTEITDAATFWPAEDYHQDYLANHPERPCHVIRRALPVVTARIERSDAEWQKLLTPEQYHILRHGGTDAPFCAVYEAAKKHGAGVYRCAGCALELFDSSARFVSGTGWPSFSAALRGRVTTISDTTHGMERVEIRCYRCAGHLGHVFEDGPEPSGLRYCVNGSALVFMPR